MTTVAEALHLARQALQGGNLPQGEMICRQVLQVDPQNVEALYLLAVIAYQVGRGDLAIEYARQALRLMPDMVAARRLLGALLADLGKLDEAIYNYQYVLRLQPNDPEIHNNLGLALQQLRRLEEAVVSFRQALQLRPNYAEAQVNLGNTLRDLGQLEEAVASHNLALQLRPEYAEAHINLGNALWDLGRLDEATTNYREALRLRPEYAAAHNNLGVVLKNLGHFGEAIGCFERAVQLQPEYADAHYSRSMIWLMQGDYKRGWQEYEWRWRCNNFQRRSFSQPRWGGFPLEGRTILLYPEQGLGDTLQFVRYASLVQKLGGRVLLECQPPLVPLLAHCPGIDQLVAQGDPLPTFDVEAPLLSLPGILGTTLECIPNVVPYLHIEPSRACMWRLELESEGFKVGIAWQGSHLHTGDRWRSLPLSAFAPLSEVSGVRLFSLQKGPGIEQLAGANFPVIDLGSRLENFADTAAVIQCLDLVIAVDTAVVHCAGGLGKPAWVLLPFAADWRWLTDREDSPWYPSIRLFRQQQPGQWAPVFDRVAQELHKLVQAGATGG